MNEPEGRNDVKHDDDDRKAGKRAVQTKLDWNEVLTYTGGNVAILRKAGSRRRRAAIGAADGTAVPKLRVRSVDLEDGSGVDVNGEHFETLEAAYVAGCYSAHGVMGRATGVSFYRAREIQRRIQEGTLAEWSKRDWLIRPGREIINVNEWREREGDANPWTGLRPGLVAEMKWKDWTAPGFCDWLLFLVWSKIGQNPGFAKRIRDIPKKWTVLELIEDGDGGNARTWGCREIETGVFQGANNLGKIVMECRDAMRERRAPRMDVDALNACGICLFSTSRLAFAPPELLPHSASERQREHCRKAGRVKSEAKAAAVRKNIQKAIAARRTKS